MADFAKKTSSPEQSGILAMIGNGIASYGIMIIIVFGIVLYYNMYMRSESFICPRVLAAIISATPGARRVDLYVYHRKPVLLVDAPTPVVYDLRGSRLGAPTSGVVGSGDGTMIDWPNAEFVRTVMSTIGSPK